MLYANPERAQARAAETMQDTCLIQYPTSGAANAYGVPVVTYSAGISSPCGYKARSSREVQQGNETVIIDAELRLPYGTTIDSKARIKLTHRFGQELTVKPTFNVIGEPEQGFTAIVVNLVKA